MADYALTELRHGKADGEVVVVEQFDEIPKGLLTEDELKELRAGGSIGAKPVTPEEASEERDALRARIAELEAKLAEKPAVADKAPAGGSK